MAQAPGPTGAPRQNKTVKEFKGMNTQNRRNAIPEGSFAWLENIQPIGPGHLHSIPGRGEALVRIPPIVPPELCTDSTLRGQAVVTIEDRFDQANSFPPFTNLRTSWAYITANEEVWTLIGNASGSGGNMVYDTTDCQINHWQSNVIVSHPALIDPNPLLPAINTCMGTSDEPLYGFTLNNLEAYYPNTSTHVTYTLPAGIVASVGLNEPRFAKKGNSIWLTCHDFNIGPPHRHVVEYNAVTGVQLNDYTTLLNQDIFMIALTDSYLYALCAQFDAGNLVTIKKLNRSDGTVADTFWIDNIGAQFIAVVNDDLIYVLTASVTAGLYYVENFTDLVYVGNSVGQGFTAFANGTAQFINGALYYGSNGFAGFSTDIFKITVECPPETSPPSSPPPAPVVASITRGSASVAAGANIVVSWADVLLPVANDHIWLLPAPTPPDLGIIAANLIVSRITDGLGTSSMNFLIPLATPPGTYILAYMANDVIYVAKTATFTVT